MVNQNNAPVVPGNRIKSNWFPVDLSSLNALTAGPQAIVFKQRKDP